MRNAAKGHAGTSPNQYSSSFATQELASFRLALVLLLPTRFPIESESYLTRGEGCLRYSNVVSWFRSE